MNSWLCLAILTTRSRHSIPGRIVGVEVRSGRCEPRWSLICLTLSPIANKLTSMSGRSTLQRDGELRERFCFLAGVGPQMGSATALICGAGRCAVALAAAGRAIQRACPRSHKAGGTAIALQCDLTNLEFAERRGRGDRPALSYHRLRFLQCPASTTTRFPHRTDDDVWQMTMDG